MLPPLIQNADPRPDLAGRQAWALPVLGAPYLWCAAFTASVPHDLVAAFASSLDSPVPVRTVPECAKGWLTVGRRSRWTPVPLEGLHLEKAATRVRPRILTAPSHRRPLPRRRAPAYLRVTVYCGAGRLGAGGARQRARCPWP